MGWIRKIFDHGDRGSVLLLVGFLICVISGIGGTNATANSTKETWNGFSTSCTPGDTKNASVSCYGVRIVRKIVQQLLEKSTKEPNIEIFDGVSLVEAPGGGTARRAKMLNRFGGMELLVQFLEGRELRIKLPSLLPQNFESALQESLPAEQGRKGGGGYGGGGGGGGKKGGGGGILLVGLMMGKMMAAMGFAGLGLLTMKALMVSTVALALSMVIALKKLVHSGDDGGGHHVVYAQEVGHHHRRKRNLGDPYGDVDQLAYRGYAGLFGNSRLS